MSCLHPSARRRAAHLEYANACQRQGSLLVGMSHHSRVGAGELEAGERGQSSPLRLLQVEK